MEINENVLNIAERPIKGVQVTVGRQIRFNDRCAIMHSAMDIGFPLVVQIAEHMRDHGFVTID